MSETNEKNKNIEIITGDPKKAIRKLSIPMMLSMVLIMMYNLADSIWVAGLGPDALAAIGFITPLFMVLIGLGHGIGAGANSLIARNIGAENPAEANNAGLHGIVLSIIVSIIFTILMLLAMKPILVLMGAGKTMTYAYRYGNIVFGFLIVFVFSAVLSAVFRSEGDMKRAVIPIAATSILNIILDPIFIYQLNMGIEGAAIATVISSAVSILIMAYWIWIKKDLFLDLTPKNFKYDSQMMKDTLHVAIPSTLENIIFSTLAVIVNTMLVIVAGTDAVAAYTAAMRIVQMCMIPMMGIGTALLTIAGVAYGAHNYKNLKIGYNYAVKQGFIISIVLAILMIVFCNQISSIFAYTSASASLGPQIAYSIRILSLFVVAIPHGIMSSMMFQGVGKGPKALKITLLRSLAFESILAYLFGFILNFGLIGIYAGIILGCFLGGTVGFIWSKFFIDKFQMESKDRYEGIPAK